MSTLEQVEVKLRASMAAARANGVIIVRHQVRGPFNASPCACAVGTMVLDIPGGIPLYGIITDRLGCKFNDTIAIARGFDGEPYDNELSEPGWHYLGERLYSDLQEGTL